MNIDEMEKKLQSDQQQADKELKLISFLKEFDANIRNTKKSRYSRNIWISERANKEATDLDYYFGCGCCSDTDYNVRPVMTLDFNGEKIQVYGDRVYLGNKDYDHYLCHFNSEEEITKEMQQYNYNQTLIDKVLQRRDSHLKALENINNTLEDVEY